MPTDILGRDFAIGDRVAFAFGHQTSGQGGGWLCVLTVTALSDKTVTGDLVVQAPGPNSMKSMVIKAPSMAVILR